MRRIGLVTFSDGRARVHQTLLPSIRRHIKEIKEMAGKLDGLELIVADRIVTDSRIAVEESKKMVAQDVDGTIFNFPVWNFPNYTSIAATIGKGPYLFLAKRDPENPGLVGLLCSKGGIDQLGYKYMSVWGDLNDEKLMKKVDNFTRVAHMMSSLKGQTFGVIGGRSMGMYTAVPSLAQWQRQFGVDIEHIDQLEIVRLAKEVPEDKVKKALAWLKGNVAEIAFDGKKLTKETLSEQIRCYYATKKIVEDYNLDFFGVKCHYELSEYYVPQCLSAAFFNDPYDFDGKKAPVIMGCEADADGTLTMQILHLITEKPVLFFDFRDYDPEYNCYVFCNCGSQATWFAAAADDAKENLKNVSLLPTVPMFKGGGAHVQYMAHPGKVTLARLGRRKDTYWMAIMRGEFIEVPKEKMRESTWEWPHAFVKMNINYDDIITKFPSNHAHATYGDWVDALVEGCKVLGIKPEVLC